MPHRSLHVDDVLYQYLMDLDRIATARTPEGTPNIVVDIK